MGAPRPNIRDMHETLQQAYTTKPVKKQKYYFSIVTPGGYTNLIQEAVNFEEAFAEAVKIWTVFSVLHVE